MPTRRTEIFRKNIEIFRKNKNQAKKQRKKAEIIEIMRYFTKNDFFYLGCEGIINSFITVV